MPRSEIAFHDPTLGLWGSAAASGDPEGGDPEGDDDGNTEDAHDNIVARSPSVRRSRA